MKLPKFVVIENKSALVMPFVLMTTPPYLVGRPIIYRTFEEDKIEDISSKIANGRVLGVKMKGYSGFMLASGSLTNEDCGDIEDTRGTLREMSDFFIKERIEPHIAKYKKSKEDTVQMR